MGQEFGVAEIRQRTKDDALPPLLNFDVARFAYAKRAGSQRQTIVDVQAAGTSFATFTAARAGLYRLLAVLSSGVLANPRVVILRFVDHVSGNPVWEIAVTMTSNARQVLELRELFLDDGSSLQFTLVTAMVLGDDMTGSITNWELVV